MSYEIININKEYDYINQVPEFLKKYKVNNKKIL